MALPPITTNSQNFQTPQTSERPRQEQELEQAQATNNVQVEVEDNRTTAQPVEEASEADAGENDPRLNQQLAQQRQTQEESGNSADNNLGSQIDISV